jgi:dTDP-4-dehydrorhamnose 3,5-epimerase
LATVPEIIATKIPEVRLIRPPEFLDSRGSFAETYNRRVLEAAGIRVEFVQDNQSVSTQKGTVRGLHFQIPPAAQTKLVRVLKGVVLDVAVDLRKGSPTYGQHVSQILSESNKCQFLVPEGFAHGFCTLEDNSIVFYKVSGYYSPQHERGMRWDDPILGIDWGISSKEALLSPRDNEHPGFAELPSFFEYSAGRS